MKRFVQVMMTLAVLLASVPQVLAQEVEMADAMRAEGKIYVIVAIILIVLAGLFIYLFLLDRKIRRIEERLKKENQPAT